MEGRFFDIKPAELGYDLREGSDCVGCLLAQHVLRADSIGGEEGDSLLEQLECLVKYGFLFVHQFKIIRPPLTVMHRPHRRITAQGRRGI